MQSNYDPSSEKEKGNTGSFPPLNKSTPRSIPALTTPSIDFSHTYPPTLLGRSPMSRSPHQSITFKPDYDSQGFTIQTEGEFRVDFEVKNADGGEIRMRIDTSHTSHSPHSQQFEKPNDYDVEKGGVPYQTPLYTTHSNLREDTTSTPFPFTGVTIETLNQPLPIFTIEDTSKRSQPTVSFLDLPIDNSEKNKGTDGISEDTKFQDHLHNALSKAADLSNYPIQEVPNDRSPSQMESQPLLSDDVADKQSWTEWAQETRFRRLVVKPFISAASHFRAHPGWDILAILTALPGGINAFCMITGLDPKNLLVGIAKMSLGDLLFSSFNAFCSVAFNTPMNAWFYTGLKDDLKDSKKVFSSGLLGKFIIFLAFITGVSAAVAAGSIGYSAFLWLPYGEYTAFLPAFLNAASTFVSRFNGLIRLIKRISNVLSNYFDKDLQLEKNIIEKLTRISEDHVPQLNEFLQNKNLDENTIKALFDEIEKTELALLLNKEIVGLGLENIRREDSGDIVEQINQIATRLEIDPKHFINNKPLDASTLDEFLQEMGRLTQGDGPVLREQSCCSTESAKSWAWFSLKVMLASAVGYYIFPTFDQKGYDGINTLVDNVAKLAHSGASLHDLEDNIKKLIGALPGIATLVFYWIHMYDLPDIAKDKAYQHLKNNPEDIPHAIALLVMAAFSGSSMQNVATNIAKKPDNLFGDSLSRIDTQVKIWTVGGAASAVNAKVVANKIYPAPPLAAANDTASVENAIPYVQQNHISHSVLDGFRQNSLFSKFRKKESQEVVPRNDNYLQFV